MQSWTDSDHCELTIKASNSVWHESAGRMVTCRLTINGNNFDIESLAHFNEIISVLQMARHRWALEHGQLPETHASEPRYISHRIEPPTAGSQENPCSLCGETGKVLGKVTEGGEE